MGDVEQWIFSIPVVTRTYMALALVTSIAVTFEVVSPLHLYISHRLILEKNEWWRLITGFVYFDKLSINFVFHMHFLYFYCRRLEEHFYLQNTPAFLFIMFLAAALHLAVGHYLGLLFLSYPMIMTLLYLWSRRFPNETLRIYGLFDLQAPYIAYLMLFLSVILDGTGSITGDLVGIGVGHVIWFLQDILPRITGFELLKVPNFLRAFAAAPNMNRGVRAERADPPEEDDDGEGEEEEEDLHLE
jgi:Derlin-2/3